MKKKNASAIVYLIFFITVILAFCAFAIDATIVYTMREKLQNATEATALAAASCFNESDAVTVADIKQKARNIFLMLKTDNLQTVDVNNMDIQVNLDEKQVLITTQMHAPTFFLAFLGVSSINLNAKALAVSENLSVTSNYSTINWITASGAYLSDIVSKGTNLNDTAILLPVGKVAASASYDVSSHGVKFNLLDSADNKPLSLGPAGFVTIKLPAPIVDKPGNDLYIKELGALEGYMVFAGLDVNPEKPYVQYDEPGDGLKWINISCTGTPEFEDVDGKAGAYDFATFNLGMQTKFYGSGFFDISAKCTNGFQGISMAKYIRIIDDNKEDGLVTNSIGTISPNKLYNAKLYGEASTPTAGADIDTVVVLNHVKLLPPSDFTP